MIDGEIKIGDRLQNRPEEPTVIEVIGIHPSGDIFMRFPGGAELLMARNGILQNYVRADPGWTPIAPDTLPGEDVEEILLTDGHRMRSYISRKGWLFLMEHGINFRVPWTHWRPVPDGWLPLPTKEPS